MNDFMSTYVCTYVHMYECIQMHLCVNTHERCYVCRLTNQSCITVYINKHDIWENIIVRLVDLVQLRMKSLINRVNYLAIFKLRFSE